MLQVADCERRYRDVTDTHRQRCKPNRKRNAFGGSESDFSSMVAPPFEYDENFKPEVHTFYIYKGYLCRYTYGVRM